MHRILTDAVVAAPEVAMANYVKQMRKELADLRIKLIEEKGYETLVQDMMNGGIDLSSLESSLTWSSDESQMTPLS